ncbi:uncharacterized protein [Prorops nasuta]|uniref:uncharacterized protein n=1 Tax=Prorops nasuta TaxID=863751 RepID=UPI0034CDC314
MATGFDYINNERDGGSSSASYILANLITGSGENDANSSSMLVSNVQNLDSLTVNENNNKSFDLKSLLLSDSEGQTIITVYEKTGFLTPRLRNLLVHKIILSKKDSAFNDLDKGILKEFKITAEWFKECAKQIEDIFPNETASTYYIPYQKTKECRMLTCGKLWDHYNYTKSLLKKEGLLKQKDSKSVDNLSSFIEQQTAEPATNSYKKEILIWLRNHIAPWNQVMEYWKDTFNERRQELIVEQVSVYDYFKRYQCLTQESGSILVNKLNIV